MDDLPELDNPAWHALQTTQSELAEVASCGTAARYPRKMSPFCAIEEPTQAAWDALLELVGPGRAVVFARPGHTESPPEWQPILDGTGTQYVCTDPPPEPKLDTIDLGPDDVDEMLALVDLTKPGPFLPRTIEMGHYIGIRREGRLVAMAGERLRGETFSEISAVCVHPDARRQGLAAQLTTILANEIREQGRVAMLHVEERNHAAHAVYRGIGFEPRVEITFGGWRHQADA